jgi:hypothetical protein
MIFSPAEFGKNLAFARLRKLEIVPDFHTVRAQEGIGAKLFADRGRTGQFSFGTQPVHLCGALLQRGIAGLNGKRETGV